jgi:hypothetical protein
MKTNIAELRSCGAAEHNTRTITIRNKKQNLPHISTQKKEDPKTKAPLPIIRKPNRLVQPLIVSLVLYPPTRPKQPDLY